MNGNFLEIFFLLDGKKIVTTDTGNHKLLKIDITSDFHELFICI